MAKLVRIAVIEHLPLMRQALCNHLSRPGDFLVVASAASAAEASGIVIRLNPSVILLSLDMPGLCCFAVARKLRVISPDLGVVFLTTEITDFQVDECVALRANGLLTTGTSSAALAGAVRAAAARRLFFCDEAARRTVRVGGRGQPAFVRSRVSLLTPREKEVLRYIASGMPQKNIATLIGISIKTVDSHRARIMQKLAIHDRVGLARFAIREGMVRG